MLRFISQQHHARHEECKMIELLDHPVDILKIPDLVLLVARKTDMQHEVTRPKRREHDPVHPSELPRKVVLGNLHELVPVELAQWEALRDGQTHRFALSLLQRKVARRRQGQRRAGRRRTGRRRQRGRIPR